jgi:hypothetical protein
LSIILIAKYSDYEWDRMSTPKETWWARRSRVQRLGAIALVAVVIALAIGFGVGFGIGNKKREEVWDATHDPSSTSTASPSLPTLPPTPSNLSIWQPQAATKWQIVLQKSITISSDSTNTTPSDAIIWDIDLFTNSKETITKLHSLGKKVICYFSAGSYEPDRPDSDQFQKVDLGKALKGWPDERWLNTNSLSIRNIMDERIVLAKNKGCDGIDPDNVDAYVSWSSLIRSLKSSSDLKRIMKMVSNSAHLMQSITWRFWFKSPRRTAWPLASRTQQLFWVLYYLPCSSASMNNVYKWKNAKSTLHLCKTGNPSFISSIQIKSGETHALPIAFAEMMDRRLEQQTSVQ